MEAERFLDLEQQAKFAFKEEFSQAYLDHIDKKSTPDNNMAELLWSGFAHGYMRSRQDLKNDLTIEDLARSILEYKTAHEEADKCPAMLLSNGVDPEPARIMQHLKLKRHVMYELAEDAR